MFVAILELLALSDRFHLHAFIFRLFIIISYCNIVLILLFFFHFLLVFMLILFIFLNELMVVFIDISLTLSCL